MNHYDCESAMLPNRIKYFFCFHSIGSKADCQISSSVGEKKKGEKLLKNLWLEERHIHEEHNIHTFIHIWSE